MTAMTTIGFPDRLVTLADWEQLPEDELHHVECGEGVLYVTPNPHFKHQRATSRLMVLLDGQLPAHLTAVSDIDVLFAEDPLTVRAPDVTVTSTDIGEANPVRLRTKDVLLVVEILSPGSRRIDRVTKFSEYAEAEIAHYWILDIDAPLLTCHRLTEHRTYEAAGEFDTVAQIDTDWARLTIDLAALTRR